LKTLKSNTIKRADLANAVYREIGLPKSESLQLVNSIFTKIEEELATKGVVKLSGFGNLLRATKMNGRDATQKRVKPL